MRDRSERLRRATVLLVVVCVVVSGAAPAVAAGGLGDAGADEVGVAAPQPSDQVSTSGTASVSGTASTSGASQPPDAVGPGLRSATGTVEVVVRFEGDSEFGPQTAAEGGRTLDGRPQGDRRDSAGRLRVVRRAEARSHRRA